MRRSFLLLILVLGIAGIPAFGQSSPAKLKENYDYIHANNVGSNYNCYFTGNGFSWHLQGLLNMYKTTKDKAYLVKFMKYCILVQHYRKDEWTSGDPPLWVRAGDGLCGNSTLTATTEEPLYFNSMLIKPMAEFVNMVITEPSHDLYNTNLPIHPYIDAGETDLVDMSMLGSMAPHITIIGYGDFARWLGYRVEQTLIYMNANYWEYPFGIKDHASHNCSNPNDYCGAGMNMASPYGCALMDMGFSYTNFGFGSTGPGYLAQAQQLASLLRGTVNISGACDYFRSYSNSEMAYNSADATYFWYTRAISRHAKSCFPYSNQADVTWYLEAKEDVAHGVMDLWFINKLYDAAFAPCNTCTPYFLSSDMEALHNTFTKRIAYSSGGVYMFHNNLDGTENPNSQCTSCPTNYNWREVLGWMPIYKYDDGTSSLDAYGVLMDHTVSKTAAGIASSSSADEYWSGAESYLGFTNVVQAQWEMECVNLSLYKRKVIYNQDFNVRNSITVEPALTVVANTESMYNMPSSFAEPTISTSTFTVMPNVSSTMTAGETITLDDGFTAEEGSTFTAQIVTSLCSDGHAPVMGNSGSEDPGQAAIAEGSRNYFSDALIYPNPNNGTFNITFQSNAPKPVVNKISVYTILGSLVMQTSIVEAGSIDLTSREKGVYFIKIENEFGVKTEKVVYQ
jgi:hypothetical protein